jgi:hypothetical protein
MQLYIEHRTDSGAACNYFAERRHTVMVVQHQPAHKTIADSFLQLAQSPESPAEPFAEAFTSIPTTRPRRSSITTPTSS